MSMLDDKSQALDFETEDACDVKEDSIFVLDENGKAVRMEVPDDVADDPAQ